MGKHVVAMAVGLFVALGVGADAAEVKALVSTAMKRPFEELGAQFERTTGHKLVASYGPSGALTKPLLKTLGANSMALPPLAV